MTTKKSKVTKKSKALSPAPEELRRFAVLKDRVLVGEKSRGPGIEIGDLPVDGSYKWDEKSEMFVPLGFGFERPGRPPVTTDRMLYLLVNAMVEEQPIPSECREWRDWYKATIERRNEERAR